MTIELKSPAAGVNLGSLDVRHDNECLRVEREVDTERCAYRVYLDGTLPIGNFYDTLEFRVHDTQDMVRVPVSARVVDRVSIIPTNVLLHRKDGSADFEPFSVLLVSSLSNIDLSQVRLADESGIVINGIDRLDDRRCRIRLSAISEISERPIDVKFIVPGLEYATFRVTASRAQLP